MTELRKRCSKCGEWRPRWDFYRLARGGLRADCIDCSRAAARDRQRRRSMKRIVITLALAVGSLVGCLPDPNPPSPVDNTIVRGTVIAKTISVQPWGTYFYLGIDEWSTPEFGWVLVTESEWHFCKAKPEQPNAWFRNDEQEFCEVGS